MSSDLLIDESDSSEELDESSESENYYSARPLNDLICDAFLICKDSVASRSEDSDSYWNVGPTQSQEVKSVLPEFDSIKSESDSYEPACYVSP